MRLFVLLLSFAFVQNASAYIDPGTGSILVSFMISIIITAVYYLKSLFYRSFSIFGGSGKAYDMDYNGQIVLYNEGNNYWPVFRPLVEELCRRKVHFNYLSSDKNDSCKDLDSEYCHFVYIGDTNKSVILLNHLKAKIVVMTTPQLEILKLRKSKGVGHYCHLLHAPVDIHTYKKFAFDYFDSVMCSSPFQIENLRQLESLRKREPKLLLETGCTYYDDFEVKERESDDCVLVAPTWGEKSALLPYCGAVIDDLLKAGFRVIFRPHPQSFISEKETLEEITAPYLENKRFSFDKEVSNVDSLSRSAVLIADFSGIVLDYCFLYQGTPLIIDSRQPMYGYEDYDIENRNIIYEITREIGKIIDKDDIPGIAKLVKGLQASGTDFAALREKYLFNFKNAGTTAADQLLELNERI